MKLVVEGEISATRYKQLVTRLKNYSKKQLWEILDHYIFHIITDKDVDELLRLLDEKDIAEKKATEVEAAAEDDDLFYTIDPVERFRPPVIATIPATEALDKYSDYLGILYDRNCFESYIDPEIRKSVAEKLIAYATDANLPVMEHWTEYSQGE